MKFFKKIKNFFVDDRHEEDEYYEDEYYEEDDINESIEDYTPERQTHTQEPPSSQRKSNFRFPLIDDAPPAETRNHEEPKKSAVFYDVEQDTGVKLPSHLPQQSLVYDVEVSNIAELLAKRNKSHGRQSIVRYDQSTLRTRSKGNVTADEKRFLTTNPQREDNVKPVVNQEPPMLGNRKRFIPTDVPSPVYGFKKPKPIQELIPDLEKKQEEAMVAAEERAEAKKSNLENVSPNDVKQQTEPAEVKDLHTFTQAEKLEKLSTSNIVEQQKNEQTVDNEAANGIEAVEEMLEVVAEKEPSTGNDEVNMKQTVAVPKDSSLNGEQRLQELAIQHLTIENSTVHIEQLLVEQPAPVVQPTVHIEANSATVSTEVEALNSQSKDEVKQQEVEATTVQNNEPEVSEPEQLAQLVPNEGKSHSSGSRIPFNVIMLESDKRKLQNALSKSASTFKITDWKGNVISTPKQQEVNVQVTSVADDQGKQSTNVTEQENEKGDVPFLNNHQAIVEGAMEAEPTQSAIATLEKEEPSFLPPIIEQPEFISEDNETQGSLLKDSQIGIDNESLPTEMLSIEQTEEMSDVTSDTELEAVQVEKNQSRQESASEAVVVATTEAEEKQAATEPIERAQLYEAYEKPPMDFLLPAEERTEDWAWLDEQAEYLVAALASHQVQAQIESIEQGPAVTQFEITVAQGTKVSKVRNLSDDIKLALAAKDIRIDAPIPGKRTIGIEIPNRVSRAVRLSEVTNSERFIESESPLEAALGLDLSGKPVTIDLRKMPHGLIAGATGSGKSVCINSILVSLLYKAHPNDLKLMLIDPKMVELAPFNRIPHLVSPVITDVKAATAALKWAVEEMERRYQLFMHAGVRDLTRYNQQAEKARQFAQKLPYILIVIDELADLMMMAPADVEEAICRIAQKARACGIHLIVATQRPSVDVITGLIKSNIPTRIAFAVSSAVDSRTILDTQGAERLLGRGDMLYLGNGMQAPIRLQGTFVTDDEIEDIVAYVRNQGEPNYLFAQEDLIKRTEMFEEQDELFEEVCRYVYELGTASTSSIQRNFHIGYNRAARLVDMLEKKGFISEARGSKPRDVFINESDLDEMFR